MHGLLVFAGLCAIVLMSGRAVLRAIKDDAFWHDFPVGSPAALTTVALLALAVSFAAAAKCLVAWFRPAARSGQPGFPLRVFLYAIVFDVVLQVWFFQPYQHALSLIVSAAVGGACAGLYLFKPRIPIRCNVHPVRLLDLALFNACLTLLGAEFALRQVARWNDSPFFARADARTGERIAENRLAAGEFHVGFPCNSHGYYDDELVRSDLGPQRRLVVTIGDSFSAGIVPHPLHFTTVSERELLASGDPPVDVYNMGMPAIGPPEYAHLLKSEALPLRPKLVVVNLFVGNDVGNHYGSRKWRTSLYCRENLLLWAVPRRLAVYTDESLALRRQGRAAGELQSEVVDRQNRTACRTVEEARQRYSWTANPRLELPNFERDRFLAIERDRAEAVCGARRDNYDKLFQALAAMLAEARRSSVPLAVMLIPDEFQVEDELWQQVCDGRNHLDRDQPQRLVGEWLRARGVPTLDLLPALRNTPLLNDGKRHVYHLQDTHFNARGNQIAGAALAKFLRRQLDLPANVAARSTRGGSLP